MLWNFTFSFWCGRVENYFCLLNFNRVKIKISMNLIPRDKKFSKIFKFRLGKEKSMEHRTIKLIYGNYGLKAMSTGF